MKSKHCAYLVTVLAAAALASPADTPASGSLQITYSAAGLQRLSYNGVTLEDTTLNPSDAFHIGHMKATDLKGKLLTAGQYDWGENNNGHTWDAATHTWTYLFTWGSIKIQFAQLGDTLNLRVVQSNSANSGIVFQGAAMYPLVLHFPRLPAGFIDAKYQQLAFNTTAPGVTIADYGQGQVAAVVPDASRPLYSGFEPAGPANAYFPVISGTAIDNMASFFPRNDRPVKPGETDSFTVSLRFTASGASAGSVVDDAYRSWAKVWPPVLHWPDRRIIGTAFLANSPQGNINQPGGYPNNPRRYFNNSNSADFDIEIPDGLVKFQARVLLQATATVQNLRKLHAQGVITWDIEGEQYPQPTSYVCAPDEIATVAPEMESVVSDGASRYHGMKLDDAYFKTIRDAGFRVGVCVRPQHYTLKGQTANQDVLPDPEIAAELTRKMEFAHRRWGVTLFYVDSNVEENGRILDARIFQKVAAAFPDSLIIPEQTTRKYFAYTAPFASFVFHGDTGTPADVHSYYPNAFSANMVNDVSAQKLATFMPQLIQSVKQGDILMVLADHWEPNNSAAVKIYEAAGATSKTR